MLNKECYANDDLLNFALPNDGVAEVSKGSDAVLKYELSTFVCEGQYEQGLVPRESGARYATRRMDQRLLWLRQVAPREDAGVSVDEHAAAGRDSAA